MGEFLIPEGAMPSPAPPLPDPMAAREEKIADDTRVEQSLNRFIAGKQAALFEAPDAFYRAQGEDAIHAAPVATQSDRSPRHLFGCAAFMLLKIELITSPARIGGRAAMPRKIAVARRQ